MLKDVNQSMLRVKVYDGSGKTVELVLDQEEFDTAKQRALDMQGASKSELPEWLCIEPVTGVKA